MQISEPHILAHYDSLVALARFVKHGGQCDERMLLLQVLSKLHGKPGSGYNNFNVGLPEFDGSLFQFVGLADGVLVGIPHEMITMRMNIAADAEHIAITYRGATEEITTIVNQGVTA